MRVSWEELEADIYNCQGCDLCRTRTNTVSGEGNPNAAVMFIGEGPGRDEDAQGRPFVGNSGELLTRMLKAIGLERSDVYICNIVKCRPPRNRNPLPEEALACIGFLRAQVALVQPRFIVLLGKVACRYTLGEDISVMQHHGEWYERKNTSFLYTFHPSFLLRSPEYKRAAWEDLQKLKQRLDEYKKENANGTTEPIEK